MNETAACVLFCALLALPSRAVCQEGTAACVLFCALLALPSRAVCQEGPYETRRGDFSPKL